MKYIFYPIIFIFANTIFAYAQPDSDRTSEYYFKNISHDTSGVNDLIRRTVAITFFNPDSGIILAKAAHDIAKKINYKKGENDALSWYGQAYYFLGDYPKALKIQFEALEFSREIKDSDGELNSLSFIGLAYKDLGQYRQALEYLKSSLQVVERMNNKYGGSFELAIIGQVYQGLNMPDSAIYYQRKAYAAYHKYPTGIHLKSFILLSMGDAYALAQNKDSAMRFYKQAIDYATTLNDKYNLCTIYTSIAKMFLWNYQYDSAMKYANLCLQYAQSIPSKRYILEAANLLTTFYKEKNNTDSAFFYLNIATAMKDSLYGPEKFKQMQLLVLEEQQKQTAFEKKNEQYRNRIKYLSLLSAAFVLLLLAVFLWRNNQHKKKSNILLQQEKQKVEQAYEELKTTQAQLIQKEKMASLGELTAGIAHEIQNPLNFVNNFSEVNTELIDEMKEELKAGRTDAAIKISEDIRQNNEKISFHGKRADSIVKSMLQHSRNSSGQKELTDINMLVDECMRLSFHGMRAKDKSFNAKTVTDFDSSLGQIHVASQEIGRVLLNLLTNAFYSVMQKQKQAAASYEPLVSVSTAGKNGKVEIRVKDNGNGIPQKVLDKIFQPFFTTKPTGEGTGLGLSMSYDIITKGHGGELKVETKEGEYAEFIIILPDKP
jgi:signal transduction histidine kinase